MPLPVDCILGEIDFKSAVISPRFHMFYGHSPKVCKLPEVTSHVISLLDTVYGDAGNEFNMCEYIHDKMHGRTKYSAGLVKEMVVLNVALNYSSEYPCNNSVIRSCCSQQVIEIFL